MPLRGSLFLLAGGGRFRPAVGAIATFIFRCPITRQNVQGWIAEKVVGHADTYIPVHCTACRQFHHVNLAIGQVLGNDDDK